jgi:hypothetical protein
VHKQSKIRNVETTFRGIAGDFKTIGQVNIEWVSNNFWGKDHFSVATELPIEADGILGSTFIDKYRSIIDNENFTITLKYNEAETCLPMYTKRHFEITLPPRSEAFRQCMTCADFESVILAEEVCEGVFTAGALAQPADGKVWIKFLNTREESVKIRNYYPHLLMADDFEAKTFVAQDVQFARVEKLLNLVDTHGLTKEEKESVEKICSKYPDVFYLENDAMTSTHIYKQPIRLKPEANSVYVKPYRIPHSQKQEVDRQVNQMLKNNIIEEARSEWSSPILLVPKKSDKAGNKKWRLVIDYRRLNEQLQDEKFPLANITDILDSLSGAVYFTTLDLNQGYYQLEIEEKDRSCTAFVTDKGQYQMKKLPMGLKISPSAFSRMMTVAMSGLNYEHCFVYLDDIIVFGRNLEQHNRNLMSVLKRLREVNLKLNPKKSQFLRKSVLYLGHQISEKGILPDPDKIETIKNYPCPRDANETKRFVAFANYYRKFIENFSVIASPLNRLSRKGVTFNWTGECQTAFDTLKEKLSSPVILDYPDLTQSNIFTLTTDASKIGLGAVLANANGRPVAFTSRALNKQEQNYSTTEIEILAIVWAIKHYRPYLYGRYFEVYTDHKPLIYLFSQVDPSSRLSKFKAALIGHNFSIKYVKGQDNVVADALSRITIQELIEMETQIRESSILVLTRYQEKKIREKKEKEEMEKKKEKQESDGRADHMAEELSVCEVLSKPKNAINVKVYEEKHEIIFKKHRNFTLRSQTVTFIDETSSIYLNLPVFGAALERISVLQDMVKLCQELKIGELAIVKNKKNEPVIRLLKHVHKNLKEARVTVYILHDVREINDEQTKKLILNDFHFLPTSGHAGVNRMTKNIRKYYFWSSLEKDVREFVRKCDACQRFKHSIPAKEPMVVTTTSATALSKIFMDIVGSITTDDVGYSYILTMQCELSKYVVAVPLKNKEAATVARAFVENFVLKFGIPIEIAHDCGTEFLAEIMKEICGLLHIKQLPSTAYHHQSIGALEVTHKNLGMFLRTQVAKYGGAWSSYLPYWCFAFNTTVHTETRYSPFELVFAKICVLPSNLNSRGVIEPPYNLDRFSCELKYRFQKAFADAYENLQKSKINRKEKYDLKSRPKNYEKGDLVLVKVENRKKLDPIFKGPFEVIKDLSPNIEL